MYSVCSLMKESVWVDWEWTGTDEITGIPTMVYRCSDPMIYSLNI